MTNRDILRHVDHTLLSPTVAWSDIQTLCEEALRYETASVCIPPSYVAAARKAFPALCLCTVIGFPLGYDTSRAKLAAAEQALSDGADELDTVINLADVKDGRFAQVAEEMALLRKAAGQKILKIIIETCYLNEAEKIRLCRLVTESGADYIKTSTGFGSGGATTDDARLLLAHAGAELLVKASGGIRSREDMELYLGLGCRRLGTSKAVALLGSDV